MKTIIFVSLCLCLLVSITAEKSSHKHAGKLLKSGHELKGSNANLDATADAKSPLPLPENSPAVKPAAREGGGRKHHRHGKNKKGAHHQQEQQQQQHTGRSRKSHGKSKVNNNNGPTKTHSKHGRKHGRGKQAQ